MFYVGCPLGCSREKVLLLRGKVDLVNPPQRNGWRCVSAIQFNPIIERCRKPVVPGALIWIRRQVVDDAFGKVSGACAAVRSIS